ncbi:MAG: hypothetical protein IJD21_03145 [Oscillospiraceae bacterium]|nr:hypothetical protein [Oscillospiraceae bacterium]
MLDYINRRPADPDMPLRLGDLVRSSDLGRGVVVGFSSDTGNPCVFCHDWQRVFCVEFRSLHKETCV